MPSPLVSFCIATCNRGPILIDCLQKIVSNGLSASQCEILIVDNASTDNTADLVTQHFPQVTLIRLPKNRGPVAKNFAIQKARGEFIILLDDDAYPHPGAVPQMIRHFQDDKNLAAAVFDVTLPDGSKESSAYPDVFIGAGTGLRKSALDHLGRGAGGPLPNEFFMQAEEYDLSFRLLNAGYSIQRFWDLPLTHLKTPDARISQRTTRLDVRNNLYLLAKYIPRPLCHQLAADWLARYFLMATQRDTQQPPHPKLGTHKQAFLKGAAQGLANWSARRDRSQHLLAAETVERVFKFEKIKTRMQRAVDRAGGGRRIMFADLGKNMLAYYRAARELNLEVLAIIDDNLAASQSDQTTKPTDCNPSASCEYRGIPLVTSTSAPWQSADLVIVSNLSPIQAPRRAAALKRLHPQRPIVDLFSFHANFVHLPSRLARSLQTTNR